MDEQNSENNSQPTPLIHAKISQIMAEMDAVGKKNNNKQQGWSFRSIDQLKNASNPIFRKHQVYYTPEVLERIKTEEETRNGTKMNHFEVRVKYRLYAIDGSFVEAVVWGEAADSGDKGLGKAQTYAEKVMLIQVLNIPTEEQAAEDPDHDQHEFRASNNFSLKPAQPPLPDEKVSQAATSLSEEELLKSFDYIVQINWTKSSNNPFGKPISYWRRPDQVELSSDISLIAWDELKRIHQWIEEKGKTETIYSEFKKHFARVNEYFARKDREKSET